MTAGTTTARPADRVQRHHQALRARPGRRPSDLHRAARPGHRLPRSERLGKDHHPAHAARPGPPHRRNRHHRRAELPGAGEPDVDRRRGPGGDQLPPGPPGPHASAHGRPGRRARRQAGRRGAGTGGPHRGRQAQGRRLLHGHAPTARAGHRPHRRPRVLILDEPSNGLDPQGIAWLRDFMRYLAGEGRTVLVSSHLLSEMAQTIDDADHRVLRPAEGARHARRRSPRA